MIRRLSAALAAVILFASPSFAEEDATHIGNLAVSAPFTRATLPNAPVGGGYLTIENTGTEPDRLVSITSPVSNDVEVHTMTMDGDVMTMKALDGALEIPAGETVTLAPSGLHIMFMNITQPFVEGETVPVTLNFEKAGALDLELPVLGPAADGPMAGHHHHH